MNTLGKGVLIASAAASLVIGGQLAARATDKAGDEPVHCAGINACKGQGACGGATHDCAGKNDCKGKGWVETSSADECTKKGGKVVDEKK
jgi:hypothetical protein